MVVHDFNPVNQEAEASGSFYNYRLVWATLKYIDIDTNIDTHIYVRVYVCIYLYINEGAPFVLKIK